MIKKRISVVIRSLREKQQVHKDRFQNPNEPYQEYCKGVYFGLQMAIAMLCKTFNIWED